MRSSSKNNANVFAAIQSSETFGKKVKNFVRNSLENVGFKNCRTLKAHYSCVNTVEFSKGCADLMCSGSDDKRVLLWKIPGISMDHGPVKAFTGHVSNIFCAVFTSDNRHIISCGNDARIFLYDVEKSGRSATTHNVKYPYVSCVNRYSHDGAVYRVSIKPDADDVFLSASDDCTIVLWDVRSSERQGTIQSRSAFNSVEFNHTNLYNNNIAYRQQKRKLKPTQTAENENNSNNNTQEEKEEEEDLEPNINDSCFHSNYGMDSNLFTTCSSSNGIQLWDIRNCFGEKAIPVLEYSMMGMKDATSVSFNTAGDHFVASIPKFYPTLYKVTEGQPLAVFYADEFKNSCTAKSCCFAGEKDDYIASGSDDFHIYVWKVPSKSQIDEHVLATSGFNNNNNDSKNRTPDFEEPSPETSRKSKTRKINLDAEKAHKVKKLKMSKGHDFVLTVNSPKEVLTGHRSIVNNVRYNYSYSMLASSGVEKVVKLWSCFPIADEVPLAEVPKRQYSVVDYLHILREIRTIDREEATLEESETTLALFDFFRAYENADSSSDIDDEEEGAPDEDDEVEIDLEFL